MDAEAWLESRVSWTQIAAVLGVSKQAAREPLGEAGGQSLSRNPDE